MFPQVLKTMSAKPKAMCNVWILLLLPVLGTAAANDLRLVDAVEKGNRETARSLLNEPIDVNAAQADGATALHWAAHWNDLEMAELLIRAGANTNAANDYSVTPLSLACTNGSAAMVDKLLNVGADPNLPLPTGETALMTCAWTGNAEAVKHLLESGADVHARESRSGQTALMWALEQRHSEAARALVDGGADVHARSQSGFTPLLFAAKQGDLESVRILLAAGANTNEGTPVRSVTGRRRAGTVPDGMNPLLMASVSGHEDLALFLLENGADPNAADGTGATALHYALLKGMALVGAVSTRLAVNTHVFRPNMMNLVHALLARGGNPNARLLQDPRLPGNTPRFSLIGATPFLFATATGDVDLMRFLMESGADPMLATTKNATPLMVAAGLGNTEDPTEERKKLALEAAKMLVELGANVNAVGENDWTALHGAAYTGADAMAQFLVEKGAQLDVEDAFGQTPFSIATGQIGAFIVQFQKKPFGPHPSTADLLLQLGADPSAAKVLDSEGAPVIQTR